MKGFLLCNLVCPLFLAGLLLLLPLGREINADVRTGFPNYDAFLMLGSVWLVFWLIVRSLGWLVRWQFGFIPLSRRRPACFPAAILIFTIFFTAM